VWDRRREEGRYDGERKLASQQGNHESIWVLAAGTRTTRTMGNTINRADEEGDVLEMSLPRKKARRE